jgi:N6-L-threonylcarbamoyladenine synthase
MKMATNPGLTILAIETSCDETAAAVVRNGTDVLANVVASQIDAHRRYGGVVPEVASRQHIMALPGVISAAVTDGGGWDVIDAVATTYGPGLSGALLTGINAAKGIAWMRELPLIGVNHIEAHIYANWIAGAADADAPGFPLIALIVSGGHTLLALLTDHGRYQVLGQTRDDAAGEAFDKSARLMGLGFPGGPAIERAAQDAPTGMTLPRAWLRESYDFSFSGLKTAVLHQVQAHQGREAKLGNAWPTGAPDRFTLQLAHAFQESVVDVLVSKTVDAARAHGATAILLAGGVAANGRLRAEMQRRAKVPVRWPPIALCTDNAAMVGAAAFFRSQAGLQSGWDLDVQPNLKLV